MHLNKNFKTGKNLQGMNKNQEMEDSSVSSNLRDITQAAQDTIQDTTAPTTQDTTADTTHTTLTTITRRDDSSYWSRLISNRSIIYIFSFYLQLSCRFSVKMYKS